MEVAGVPSLSPRQFETLLKGRLADRRPEPPVRVIRVGGPYALAAVPHTEAAAARAAWNRPSASGAPGLRTLRTFGTLRKGKDWLARWANPAAARATVMPRPRS